MAIATMTILFQLYIYFEAPETFRRTADATLLQQTSHLVASSSSMKVRPVGEPNLLCMFFEASGSEILYLMPQLSRGRMVCGAYTRDLAFRTGKTSRSDGGGGAGALARTPQASHDLCIGLRSHGYDATVPLTRRFWGQHTQNVSRTTVSDLRTNG